MQITPIPCLTDNYAYIINDKNSGVVGVVDPSEAQPIISFLTKNKLKLNYILNTHHHYDHVGGNTELKKLYNSEVVGFVGDKHRIPGINIALGNNESWMFGDLSVKILHIPGHTLGHICFFFEKEKIAFTGDTLFSLGCGKIFEGNHKQMLDSLNKIKKLPKNTKIYCGHEYTYKNAEFCMKYDPNNKDLKKKFEIIKKLRFDNLPTIPAILEEELKSNIFLRCDQNDLKVKLNMKNDEDYKVFRIVRDLKDVF
ncbi:hydroxyacylglutathione hydrolase [Pelagibacteraceae bacterium]|jgi:hydroxyacylglutathione hydrolase|nr:hydroxyacylglutathione hydrolase [Pelagibacteraceae bacterium]